jgi:hypothetical protein
MLTKRDFLMTGAAAVLLGATGLSRALAHHGWRWTEDGNFELTGIIRSAQLGNPHGVLTVDVNGELWIVEVGQPWRNARAGLEDEMLAVGREVTISGARSADPAEKKVKAERVIIDGRLHDLYPNRN